MSVKFELYPLSRTGDKWSVGISDFSSRARSQVALTGQPDDLRILPTRLVYHTEPEPQKLSSRHRDMILGLLLAVSVSVVFWTSAGLLLARLLN
jgi:hypothetical protein